MNRCRILTPPDFNLSLNYLFLSVNIGTSLVAVTGNALVIVTLCNSQILRTRSNIFLLYLSTLDMTVGLTVQQIIWIVVIAGQLCISLLIIAFLGGVLCGASFNLLAIISYDRYLNLSKLKNYSSYMTSRKSKVLVSVALVFPALAGCFIFHKDTERLFYFLGGLGSLVPMVTISFCHYKSWEIVKSSRKTASTRNKRTDKQWWVAKAMGLIVLFCIVSGFPYFIYEFFKWIRQFIENNRERNDCREYVEIGYFCLLCEYANSSINSFLYCFRNKAIRQGMQPLFNRNFF